ncbi:MAG: deoxyhypusine synthase family protein [Patescibacteria group bacterium]|nr:deoxyhypusine synthase family protein [Patescibacteria group bacterium]
MTQEASVLDKLVPLEPLDLAKCFTVNDIVTGMSKCSFGARMLGEMADTLGTLIHLGSRPTIVSDLPRYHPLRQLLQWMCQDHKWFDGPHTTESFLKGDAKPDHTLVVGQYNRYDEDALFAKCNRMYFVNGQYQCRTGQVRDGYFPNVVFADESLVMPILYSALAERLTGNACGVDELMSMLKKFGGVAKETVHGAYTLYKMLTDEDSTNMFTVSGAMTVGKMQLLVADLIDTGRIKYVAATGALMAHGLIEGSGCKHYKYDPNVSDEVLASLGLNRVTDSLEPETNFDHIEEIVTAVLNGYDGHRTRGSNDFYRDIGKYIVDHYPGVRSILASAYHQDIPIVTPAFIDSELGNDVFVHNVKRLREQLPRLVFNSEEDTAVLFKMATEAKRLGIFTIGGGVPRNNTQNVAPLHEIYNHRLGIDQPACSFHYGVRIDPAQMALGHLSGCTYSEGSSWRKFDFEGPRAEIRTDATIAWPFMQRFALEKLGFYKAAA